MDGGNRDAWMLQIDALTNNIWFLSLYTFPVRLSKSQHLATLPGPVVGNLTMPKKLNNSISKRKETVTDEPQPIPESSPPAASVRIHDLAKALTSKHFKIHGQIGEPGQETASLHKWNRD